MQLFHNRIMRLLRFKHDISIAALARAAKVSHQRISQIELSHEPATAYHRALIAEAFDIIADERGQDGAPLRRDLSWLEYNPFDFTEIDCEMILNKKLRSRHRDH